MSLFRFLVFLSLLWPIPVLAQTKLVIPNFWDPQERFIKPNIKDLPRLRFLTTTDFPPFSFVDKSKRLSGFHVDLARAICAELDVSSVCQIQALPFEEITSALTSGTGEAAISGMAVSEKNREKLAFSRPYFRLPARFVAKSENSSTEPLIESLAEKSVGIVDSTAHAAYAKAHFARMNLRLFETLDSALAALQKNEVEAVFGDGLRLAFWLQSQQSRAAVAKKNPCCEFVGGPYLSNLYFGNGLSVALPKNNPQLLEAVNYALRSINDKGHFAEIYLRYFPISLY